MPNPRPNRRSVGYNVAGFTARTIQTEAKVRGLTLSDTVDLIVKEWLELSNREVPEPTLVAVHDSSVSKRINELQRTVETLAQKVQNLTLKERLGRYSES